MHKSCHLFSSFHYDSTIAFPPDLDFEKAKKDTGKTTFVLNLSYVPMYLTIRIRGCQSYDAEALPYICKVSSILQMPTTRSIRL